METVKEEREEEQQKNKEREIRERITNKDTLKKERKAWKKR